MVEQLETAADLSEIGILMDPAGEQDEEDALEEGEHEDETLENLNPKHYEFPEPAQESSLFRKIEYKDKKTMYADMRQLDKYQQMTVQMVIKHCRDLVKAEKGNRPPKQILLVVSGVVGFHEEHDHMSHFFLLINIYLIGGAGSGKSKVIENITNWVNYICSGAETGEGGHTTEQPLIVKCAFTGSAADNIAGNTLSKTFSLGFDGKHTSLTDGQRDPTRELFSKVSSSQ